MRDEFERRLQQYQQDYKEERDETARQLNVVQEREREEGNAR